MNSVANAAEAVDLSTLNGIFELSPADVVPRPFPHVIKQDILESDFCRELNAEIPTDNLFDNRGKRIGARTGRDFYRGDPGFDEFIEENIW